MNTSDGGQSGQGPDEALRNGAEDGPLYERVHVDAVRAWVAVRVKETSYRTLADELSIGKSTLEKFVKKGSNPSKIWYRLRQGYLQDQKERKGSLQDPTDMAILVLETVANVPRDERARAIRVLAETLETIHRDSRAPRPDWLAHLFALADQEEAARAEPPPKGAEYDRPRRTRRKPEPPDPA